MLHHLKDKLLAMRARDEAVRTERASDGSLFEGYDSRMEAVHRESASELQAIVEEHGWPDAELVGAEGAEAAWLLLQHSIGNPQLMRFCRNLIEEAGNAGRIPRWQFSYLDDRIRIFEGKAQRYGTQFDLTPDGPEVNLLEDSIQVDQWRQDVGLGPIVEVLARASGLPLPSQAEYRAKQSAAKLWRRKVGWLL